MESPQKRKKFAKLVEETEKRVYWYVRALVSNDKEAEDLTQEVFDKAWRAFDRYDESRSCIAWLITIARNTVFSDARKLSAKKRGGKAGRATYSLFECGENGIPHDRELSPTNELIFRETLDRALKKLTADERMLIERVLTGTSCEEIAQEANRPLGSVRSKLSRTNKKLQRILESAT